MLQVEIKLIDLKFLFNYIITIFKISQAKLLLLERELLQNSIKADISREKNWKKIRNNKERKKKKKKRRTQRPKISFQFPLYHQNYIFKISQAKRATRERTTPKFHKNRYIARKELDVRKKKERKKKKKKRRTQRPKISFQNSIKGDISRKELDIRKKKERKKKAKNTSIRKFLFKIP